ncbi:hypothetical protein [Planctomycetes bacterium K23_9]|uniref:hypothetical protein n=1 Tax=Stieleria marina TaxID=1930275 RepID=UPI0011A386A7
MNNDSQNLIGDGYCFAGFKDLSLSAIEQLITWEIEHTIRYEKPPLAKTQTVETDTLTALESFGIELEAFAEVLNDELSASDYDEDDDEDYEPKHLTPLNLKHPLNVVASELSKTLGGNNLPLPAGNAFRRLMAVSGACSAAWVKRHRFPDDIRGSYTEFEKAIETLERWIKSMRASVNAVSVFPASLSKQRPDLQEKAREIIGKYRDELDSRLIDLPFDTPEDWIRLARVVGMTYEEILGSTHTEIYETAIAWSDRKRIENAIAARSNEPKDADGEERGSLIAKKGPTEPYSPASHLPEDMELQDKHTASLSKVDGNWIQAVSDEMQNVYRFKFGSLKTARSNGRKNNECTFGIDKQNRIWRVDPSDSRIVWYLKSSVKKNARAKPRNAKG